VEVLSNPSVKVLQTLKSVIMSFHCILRNVRNVNSVIRERRICVRRVSCFLYHMLGRGRMRMNRIQEEESGEETELMISPSNPRKRSNARWYLPIQM
jgi:hypothetical protein